MTEVGKKCQKGPKNDEKSQKIGHKKCFLEKDLSWLVQNVSIVKIDENFLVLLYNFRTYFFPLGNFNASISNLLTTANNYRKFLSDFF